MNHAMQLHERVQSAIRSIGLANNGYADIGSREDVAEGVRAAGYVVIRSTDTWGLPTFKAFTKAAQAAMRQEYATSGAAGFAVPTIKPIRLKFDAPDYEGAILARQERRDYA